jgi:hypothetical protein
MHGSKNGRFRLAHRPADYKRLGIAPDQIAQFEDGQRIGTESGRYEWWYFDAHLDDGATVVVVFYTKPNVSPNGPLAPRITIDITLPDGRTFQKFLDTSPELFHASKSTCDVRIGTNRFVGDLNRYHITANIEEISVDIELTGVVPAWRPKSGHLYFGAEGREKLFAWLPSVPHGLATVRYRIGNEERRAAGSGYHDHNWGDVPMQTLMHNWYWARASVGPYTIIASYITATAAYGYETQIVYMLAKDGKVIADDDAKVSFESDRVAIDGKTGKPVADPTGYPHRPRAAAQADHRPADRLRRRLSPLRRQGHGREVRAGRARGAFRRSCHLGADVFRQGATLGRRDLKFLLSCQCSGQSPLRAATLSS